MLGLLCGLVLLVNLTTVVAIGYGGPDDFVLKENAKGGLYRVGHALSWETRSQIVALWLAGYSYMEVSRQMRRAYNTVRNIVDEYTTSGRLAPRAQTGAWSKPPKMRIRELLYLKVRATSTRAAPRRREKKFAKLTIPPLLAFSLQFLVKARPDITCAEVVARLRLDLDVHVSEPTVCRAFKYLKQTRKRKTRSALLKTTPRNMLRTQAFMQWQMTRRASQLVFVDEMGIRAADAVRNYARSREGTAAVQPDPGHNTGERGVLMNFLCALGVDGMLPCSYDVQGVVNSEVFELWVVQMLIPAIHEQYPFGGIFVVMDNASFHRNRVLEDIFERAGMELRFVPSYSPEYNPIETAFAWVKAHVRRTPTESIRDIPAATFTALNAVSGDLAKAWMRHSNYVVE